MADDREVRSRIHPGLAFISSLAVAGVLEWLAPLRGIPRYDTVRIAVAATLLVAGLAIWAVAFRTMRLAGTSVEPGEPVSALVTSGPFRFSRNPLYVGLILVSLCFVFLTNSPWFLAATIALWLLLNLAVIPGEERFLDDRFGESFRAYRSRVRRWV